MTPPSLYAVTLYDNPLQPGEKLWLCHKYDVQAERMLELDELFGWVPVGGSKHRFNFMHTLEQALEDHEIPHDLKRHLMEVDL